MENGNNIYQWSLASIESEEENEFVYKGMLKCVQETNPWEWIGLNNLFTEGKKFLINKALRF